MGRTHYEILGVTKEFAPEELKAAYRRLSRTAHPDVGGSAALFGMVQDAYETLKDPLKRSAYDRELRDGAPQAAPEPEPPPRSPGRPSTPPPRASGPPPRPPRASDYWSPPPEPSAPAGDTRTVQELKEDALEGTTWLARLFYGVGMVGWVALSQLVRDLERAWGLEWVEEGGSVLEFLSHPSWVLTWFLVGAFLVAIPWESRMEARPFPWWEQLLVAVSLAFAVPLGTWWFSGWAQGGSLAGSVVAYWLITKYRPTRGDPSSSRSEETPVGSVPS